MGTNENIWHILNTDLPQNTNVTITSWFNQSKSLMQDKQFTPDFPTTYPPQALTHSPNNPPEIPAYPLPTHRYPAPPTHVSPFSIDFCTRPYKRLIVIVPLLIWQDLLKEHMHEVEGIDYSSLPYMQSCSI